MVIGFWFILCFTGLVLLLSLKKLFLENEDIIETIAGIICVGIYGYMFIWLSQVYSLLQMKGM